MESSRRESSQGDNRKREIWHAGHAARMVKIRAKTESILRANEMEDGDKGYIDSGGGRDDNRSGAAVR